jgi:PAS domain S-box-containing protein
VHSPPYNKSPPEYRLIPWIHWSIVSFTDTNTARIMRETTIPHHTARTNSLIRYIVEHTHHEYGEPFFKLLVKHLAEALGVQGAWVTEYLPGEEKLRSLAFWLQDSYVAHYEYYLADTPCERVVSTRACFLVPDKVVELFPKDPDLAPLNAVSYMGFPLLGPDQRVVGHLAILHNEPLEPTEEQEAIFNLFAQRANAEFLRLKTEEQLLERKLKLSALVNSVHDAIVEIDTLGFITFSNPAAHRLFGIAEAELTGSLVFSLFDEESGTFLRHTLKEVRETLPPAVQSVIRQELQCFHLNGEIIPAEASICWYEVKSTLYLTLLLRDIKALKRAEQRIALMEERPIPPDTPATHGIIGASQAIRKVMDDLAQVAPSSSTLLLLGESGTGKEVFARYIHACSLRREKPLIKVNCAAIPANLIESEFFGHEKGAFTGAVSRRDGRFTLADGGTLFLDEVGELPLEMQPKLLRVLQEGEFETVGGQRTLKVNVRIIAATNRDLQKMVSQGTFREDLYYRLNVIPVALPPLRDRPEDIPGLADAFIRKFSRQAGKSILPLPAAALDRLLGYHWPGNIRELEHVIERAVVLSRDGRLALERFLPAAIPACLPQPTSPGISSTTVLTAADLQQLERENIRKALQLTSGRIAGHTGAASLLGIPPSTLNSKIKALGITRTGS